MTTEHLREVLGPRIPSEYTEDAAREELKAIEEACRDYYLNGFGGMRIKHKDLLATIGAYANGETE